MIVEDGTGKSDANSYVSVDYADAYFAARNVVEWSLISTPTKQANLIQGTDYSEATYGQSFKGQKATATQALAWPRKYVVIDGFDVASNHIPPILMNAVCELALKVQDGPLVEDQKQRVAKKKVDVLEVTYADNSDPAKRFPMVARMLSILTTSASDGGGFQSVKVVRV
jgi:hypothetical protein